MKKLNIAIWHNEDIHFEMLPYILEYLQNYDNITFQVHLSVFFPDSNIANTFINYYKKYYNNKITWIYHHELFETVEYDAIILISDSNRTYSTYLENKYDDKIISIEHWYTSRCEKSIAKLGVRDYFNRPEVPSAMPCYNYISKIDKLEAIKNEDKINILFIGRFNIPSSTTFAFFENADNINFYYLNWRVDMNALKYLKYMPNLNIYDKISTEDMMKLMERSHYVFFYPNYIEGYPQHKTSASLHLSFSTLCKAIIPKSWNIHYKFDKNTVIEYDDLDFLTPKGQLILNKEDYLNSIAFIVEERRRQISKRNTTIDKLIKKICNKEPYVSSNNSWFSNKLLEMSIIKPKVFVETGTYLGNGIKSVINDFREIHSIDIKKKFIENAEINFNNIKKVNLHYGDSSKVLNNLVDTIYEPTIFFLDAHYSGGETSYGLNEDKGCPLLRELNILSKRNHDDIIIIDDMRLMGKISVSGIENSEYPPTEFDFRHITIENITNNYKKNCYIYNCNDIDRIVLLPKTEFIRKEIIQICLKPYNYKNIPKFVKENIVKYSEGYGYNLYNDDCIYNLLDMCENRIKEKYENLTLVQHKKDLMQMFILYNYGGIYFDLDQEPLDTFETIINNDKEFEPTFVCGIPAKKEDGLIIGFMAASKYNPIIKRILDRFLEITFEGLSGGKYYVELCYQAGEVLKQFMSVSELEPGKYEVNGERILLLKEEWEEGDYSSCRITFNGKELIRSRYEDYPWNLKE